MQSGIIIRAVIDMNKKEKKEKMRKKAVLMLMMITVTLTCALPVSAKLDGESDAASKLHWKSEFTHKTMAAGKTFSLKKRLSPSDAKVTYSSEKESVATVSKKGLVKAIKKGKATIVVQNRKTKEKLKYYIHVGEKVKKLKWKNAGKKMVIYIGEKFDFNTKCAPVKPAYKKVIYKSSKPKVLTVSKKGVVKPVKNGTATITAVAADQSGKKVKCKVTVKTKAKSIKLSAVRKLCFVGESMKIVPSVLPETTSNKSVKWTTSDKKLATVTKKGIVKGVSKGTVTITATAKDGSGKKAKYTVHVVEELDPSKVWFNAHRGYSKNYPENTLQAFEMAASEGYSGVETDVWENDSFYSEEDIEQSNKTNPEFIIMHDRSLSRMCGKNINVDKLTNENIESYPIIKGNGNDPGITYKIPLLEEYIDLMAKSEKTLVIELKDDDLSTEAVTKLIELLDSKGVSSKTYIISFYSQSLLNVKEELGGRTDIKLTRLLGDRDSERFEEEIDWCFEHGMDEVSIRSKDMKDEYIERIKDYGMEAGVWVVDDKYKAADFIRKGCDHVTTNTVLW